MVKFDRGFRFGSKAGTLERLKNSLKRSRVPDFLTFSVSEWKSNSNYVLESVGSRFADTRVIVRSSANSEDGGKTSQAGVFCSVGDVDPGSPAAIRQAIDDVVASYESSSVDRTLCPGSTDDHVIVQVMVKDVLVSGVLFTQDMSTGAPYYVINYDDESGQTDTVTSGKGYTNRTLYVFRDSWEKLRSRRFRKILEAVQEIEDLTKSVNLDIEFVLDRDLIVHVLQVRPITTHPNWNRGRALLVSDSLRRIEESLRDHYVDTDSGNEEIFNTVLSNMADWNPAEMIGTTPRPLAFSLYRDLVTDRVWRNARQQMGYQERRGTPLMLSLGGQPYIDIRESFYSFLPAGLTNHIGEKLVNAWIDRVRQNPCLHDKIEFDVALTVLTPDFEDRINTQVPSTLSNDEKAQFRDSLQKLTNELLCGRRASITEQLMAIDMLPRLREQALSRSSEPRFDTVVHLIEDAVQYGTMPFSILARHGFIAVSMLRGLVHRRILSDQEMSRFQRSVSTVTTEFISDLERYAEGDSSDSELIDRYGHLRPGTYDILSIRYGEQFSRITNIPRGRKDRCEAEPFELSRETEQEIDTVLASEGYEIGAVELFDYIRRAIQAREYAKFHFTRNVSDALEVIAALGERHGLSREELSCIDLRGLVDCFIEPSGRSIESELRERANRGKEHHQIANSIRLPSVITRLEDVWIVPLLVEQPNYITRKNVRGDVVSISGSLENPEAIDNKIIAVESADPGFDWIFTRPILGLITRFGGANSHMAIRCAEFDLPAAIGCGEQIYERVVKHGYIELNCANGQILVDRMA